MGVLSDAKDRLIEQMAPPYLNATFLAPYGRVSKLGIDSSARALHLELELKGEATPVRLDVVDYEITRDGEEYFVTAKEIRASREWLTALARAHFCNKRFKLPTGIGPLLMKAL